MRLIARSGGKCASCASIALVICLSATVSLKDATYTNTIGAPALATVWTDPDFDPAVAAFYYVRALEIPTPRWTLFDAVRFKVAPPKEMPLVTQERIYSSPIWYDPKA